MLFVHKESVLVNPVGIIMAFGAGLSFASYTLISRTLLEKHSTLSVVAVVFTLSAICLSPFLFVFDMSWIMSFRGVGVSLQLGIMSTGIAYLLFAKGLVHVSSSTAVTLSLVEPLTAALLGVFVLGESLTNHFVVRDHPIDDWESESYYGRPKNPLAKRNLGWFKK